MRNFILLASGNELGNSGCQVPALYPWPKGISGYHLWKLEVFISCSDWLVVVLFWLDLCAFFIYSALAFEWKICVSQVLYSITVSKWFLGFTFRHFQVFNSGEEELVLVLFWLGHWQFCFAYTWIWAGDIWISNISFQVFKSFSGGLMVVLFSLDLWEFFLLPTPWLEMEISGSQVLHSNIVPWWVLVFPSWWLHCSYCTCENICFACSGIWTGDLNFCTLPLY